MGDENEGSGFSGLIRAANKLEKQRKAQEAEQEAIDRGHSRVTGGKTPVEGMMEGAVTTPHTPKSDEARMNRHRNDLRKRANRTQEFLEGYADRDGGVS